jgi:hypothetical protein
VKDEKPVVKEDKVKDAKVKEDNPTVKDEKPVKKEEK